MKRSFTFNTKKTVDEDFENGAEEFDDSQYYGSIAGQDDSRHLERVHNPEVESSVGAPGAPHEQPVTLFLRPRSIDPHSLVNASLHSAQISHQQFTEIEDF